MPAIIVPGGIAGPEKATTGSCICCNMGSDNILCSGGVTEPFGTAYDAPPTTVGAATTVGTATTPRRPWGGVKGVPGGVDLPAEFNVWTAA